MATLIEEIREYRNLVHSIYFICSSCTKRLDRESFNYCPWCGESFNSKEERTIKL